MKRAVLAVVLATAVVFGVLAGCAPRLASNLGLAFMLVVVAGCMVLSEDVRRRR